MGTQRRDRYDSVPEAAGRRPAERRRSRPAAANEFVHGCRPGGGIVVDRRVERRSSVTGGYRDPYDDPSLDDRLIQLSRKAGPGTKFSNCHLRSGLLPNDELVCSVIDRRMSVYVATQANVYPACTGSRPDGAGSSKASSTPGWTNSSVCDCARYLPPPACPTSRCIWRCWSAAAPTGPDTAC